MAKDLWVALCWNGNDAAASEGISVNIEGERAYILATARELYGRVVYSHKTHEQEREIWGSKTASMNVVNVFLTGLTTLFAIISASLTPTWALMATAISAVATVVFVVWQSSFDPAGKENSHRTAAKELLWIREQLLLLIMEAHMASVPDEKLEKELDTINRELTAVYKFAPNTSQRAYVRAETMIKTGHMMFSDDEIDCMLPTALRKTQP
jgi:conflict system pore-forming effector with SLATT domain